MTLAEILSPLEQEGTKSVVRAWLKAPGDAVRADDPIVELETDKVAVEVPAPADGVLAEILVEAGAEAPPGIVLGRLRIGSAPENAEPSAPARASAHAAQTTGATAAPTSIGEFDKDLRLSPSVRRLLIENGFDPSMVTGTGRGGRVTAEDVKQAIAARSDGAPKTAAASAQTAQSARAPAPPREPAKAPAKPAAGARLVPHEPMRKRIAEHMAASVATAPHVTAVFEADFSALAAHRAAHKAAFARKGINLTYTAYVVAACVAAMKVSPNVNARWHAEHLEVFDDINIGVGTSLGEKGLIVPVIHKAQTLSFEGIAARLHELTEKARAGKLAPADVQNGTFSISNHGVSGSLLASPIIINQPQSAILGVGKLEKRVTVRAVAGADAILIRPMAYVSLTIDHRVLDGHQTNAWLTRFVEVLETWPAG